MKSYEEFVREREEQNRRVLESADRVTKRFFSLDALTYRDGALTGATKELLGLVASLVLRCDDCVAYPLGRCRDLGHTSERSPRPWGLPWWWVDRLPYPMYAGRLPCGGANRESERIEEREER